MDRLLLNPWVSRAGNASFLLGVVVFAYRIVRGQDPLWLIVILLLIVGVVLMATPHVARWNEGRQLKTVAEPSLDVGRVQLEVVKPRLEPTADFPDLEFEVRATGFSNTEINPETGRPFGEPVVFFRGLRITNHEATERVNLTFHAHQPVKPEFQQGLETYPLRPATRMPIAVEPRSSETVTLYFRRGYYPPDEYLDGPVFLDVEDHLSGAVASVPTHKRWRPAKDGGWEWKG